MVAEFLTPLRMEKIGAQRWLLTDVLQFSSAERDGIVVAPRGFQTDLASIPRLLWWLFPKVDKWDAAAVIHDAGYGHVLLSEIGEPVLVTKREADRLFLEGMTVLEVNWLQRTVMYWMVRLFGDPLEHPLATHQLPG